MERSAAARWQPGGGCAAEAVRLWRSWPGRIFDLEKNGARSMRSSYSESADRIVKPAMQAQKMYGSSDPSWDAGRPPDPCQHGLAFRLALVFMSPGWCAGTINVILKQLRLSNGDLPLGALSGAVRARVADGCRRARRTAATAWRSWSARAGSAASYSAETTHQIRDYPGRNVEHLQYDRRGTPCVV